MESSFEHCYPQNIFRWQEERGRRGLDTTGNVVILCKNEVHDMSELHGMMQGKPTRLESKFRLTYSMILNLLRVEQLRVEDMMKRSFAELDTQKKQAGYAERAKTLRLQLEKMSDTSGSSYTEATNLYTLIGEFATLRESSWSLLLSLPVPGKALTSGRVVVINYKGFINVLAIILTVDLKSKQRTFQALVCLNGDNGEESKEKGSAEDRKSFFMSTVDSKITVSDIMS